MTEKVIHVVPSGADKTLCGLDAKYVHSSSITFGSNCKECRYSAQNILNKFREGGGETWE